ncbi:MAG: hypothetical protein IJ617_03810 [Oscillospiraceae bacterium]|nr:hypothetical protein [Oscillospiraceae bacterium]
MENHQPEVSYDIYVREVVTQRKIPREAALDQLPYDREAFDGTEIGRNRRAGDALYNVFRDRPMRPDVLRYWASRGLKKELFGDGGKTGFDAPNAYSVFTPLDMRRDKKYAVIYFSHGGGQSIEWAEHYGFNRLSASEKYIAVYAQNGGRSNDAVDTEFPRIIGELIENGYPVDRERIYAAGFSSGSEASVVAACTSPFLAAAVAVMPDGLPFKDLGFYTGPEYYASTKGLRIPGIFIGGTKDVCNFPARWMTDYFGSGLGAGTVENAVKNLEIWLREIARAKDAPALTRAGITEKLKYAEDPVEREFGLRFDRGCGFRAQGTDWLGGDFYGADGAPVLRMLRAEGVPHIVWDSQASLVWDYLKHFRRDTETGESLYDPMACWGER